MTNLMNVILLKIVSTLENSVLNGNNSSRIKSNFLKEILTAFKSRK